MAIPFSCSWSGVFPAATTQFDPTLQVDLPATQRVQKALIQAGAHGLVLMGTVGEGNSLSSEEKRSVLRAAVEARAIYRWFMPLLHLDAEHDLVQCIKLAEQIMGRGTERVRPPRLPLSGERRAEVIAMVERARDTRPR